MDETIVLGGGCFWCTEAVFKRIDGIMKVTPGYAGGHTDNPSYRDVCSGKTGHAEVIEVVFDPKIISFKEVLGWFFKSHDPTQVNRQGNDAGSQYRSLILYSKESQKKQISDFIGGLRKNYEKEIATQVRKLDKFYPAEPEHLEFYERNRLNPYCMFVIMPKLKKLGQNI